MPLRSIVVIVLRLFCINWVIEGVYTAVVPWKTAHGGMSVLPFQLVIVGTFLFLALAGWIVAPFLSRVLAGGENSTVETSGLTRYDLYCFAFVFLGLDYILSSVGWTLITLNQYLLIIRTSDHTDLADRTFYDFVRYGINLLAGLVALLFAGRWSKVLIRQDQTPGEDASIP